MKKFSIITLTLVLVSSISFAQKSHSDVIDVQHYIINLDITNTTSSYISGYTDVVLKPVAENTDIIPLDLLELVVDSVKCDLSDVEGFTYNDTLLLIDLATSFGPSDEITITVYYHGDPVTDPSNWGGWYCMIGIRLI
jgi:aminopeptidase N